MAQGRAQRGLSQAIFPGVSAQIALSPNAVIVFTLAQFQVDSLVRSLMVTTSGAGMPGDRGQVYVLVHRFSGGGSAASFIGEDLRAYVSNFLSKPSRYFDVRANELWQVVVYCGSQVPSTGVAVLNADLVPGGQATDAPALTLEDVGSGRGSKRTIALGDPAAGANYASVTVPGNVTWKVKGFFGQLVTSAVAGLRFLSGRKQRGGNDIGLFGGDVGTQTISITMQHVWGCVTAGFAGSGVTNTAIHGVVHDDDFLLPGDVLFFPTNALDATDNWGAGFLDIEEWAGVQ